VSSVGPVLREAFRLFTGRGARFLGAAVAFYALLSAAPLFVVVVRVVGALFGRPRAESALWGALATWIAPEGLETVRQITERLDDATSRGSFFGTIVVVYGSTRMFRALRRALNVLWGVDLEQIENKRSKVVKYGYRYGQALLFTLLVGVLVVVLLGVKTAFAFVATLGSVSAPGVLFALDVIASVALAFVLFTTLFRFLPETDVTWRDAALSAAVSTGLFAVGSMLVTEYVRHKHVADLYEGASAVVIAILWVYYSAQVFFLGACVGAALRAQRSRRTAVP
jgi:membrane protein